MPTIRGADPAAPTLAHAETKRSEFPRFYFVSDTTLLEILSLGSDPPSVIPHFQSGLFDSLSNVTFDKVGLLEGKMRVCIRQQNSSRAPVQTGFELAPPGLAAQADKTKILEMISREGERLALERPVEAKGNIEIWLQRLVDGMQVGPGSTASCPLPSSPFEISSLRSERRLHSLLFVAGHDEAGHQARCARGARAEPGAVCLWPPRAGGAAGAPVPVDRRHPGRLARRQDRQGGDDPGAEEGGGHPEGAGDDDAAHQPHPHRAHQP